VIPFNLFGYDDIITKNNKITNWIYSLMDRLTIKLGKAAIILAPLFLILPFALAEDAKYVGEDYYGNDINAAVLEADQNKRQLNYNRQHWFNRTTSKSFELPPLEQTDLEKEQLPGALGATAAGGEAIDANPELPAKEQAERIQKDLLSNSDDSNNNIGTIDKQYETTTPAVKIFSTYHEFPRGDIVTTKDSVSYGSVISTPRP
jgi:hypothetical protein